MMTTLGDSHASVAQDIQHTEYFSVRKEVVNCFSFIRRIHTGCRDLDECTEGGTKCKANTDCINTDGGHHCVCQIGFEGDPCEMLCSLDTFITSPITAAIDYV